MYMLCLHRYLFKLCIHITKFPFVAHTKSNWKWVVMFERECELVVCKAYTVQELLFTSKEQSSVVSCTCHCIFYTALAGLKI